MNTPPPPPPDDMKKTYTTMPTKQSSEADVARNAKVMRDIVEARFPGEMGKAETDTGKAIKKQLGIDGGAK